MKNIKLTSAEYKEVVIGQDDISILYIIKDDLGAIIFEKRLTLKKTDLPSTGQTALESLLNKLLAKVESDEGL